VRARGHSLVEALLVLCLLGILCGLGAAALGPPGPGLGLAGGELRGALEQALLLARAQGGNVPVALSGPGGPIAPLVLPRGVRWGLPAAGIALPPGMDGPVQAHRTGQAHPAVTVTPRGTATASVWFLTDGRDAVCLRLAGDGHLTLLRWRRASRAWSRV